MRVMCGCTLVCTPPISFLTLPYPVTVEPFEDVVGVWREKDQLLRRKVLHKILLQKMYLPA